MLILIDAIARCDSIVQWLKVSNQILSSRFGWPDCSVFGNGLINNRALADGTPSVPGFMSSPVVSEWIKERCPSLFQEGTIQNEDRKRWSVRSDGCVNTNWKSSRSIPGPEPGDVTAPQGYQDIDNVPTLESSKNKGFTT